MNLNIPILIGQNDKLSNISINNDQFTIGRGKQNSYILNEGMEADGLNVSRVHCKFESRDNEWFIQDLSTNGTFINGELLGKSNEYKLCDGCVISFGLIYAYKFKSNAPENNDIDLTCEISNPEDSNQIHELVPVSSEKCSNTTANKMEKPTETVIDISSNSLTEPKVTTDIPDPNAVEKSNKKRRLNDKMEEEMQCSICTELFIKATTLNCSHTFCNYCILEWQKKNNKCPICRLKISNTSPTLVLDNIISNMVELLSDEEKGRRKQIVIEHETKIKESNMSDTGNVKRNGNLIDLTSDSEMSSIDTDELDEDFDFDDLDDRPTTQYRGYGYCFACGDPTHWAPDCPRRRRNR